MRSTNGVDFVLCVSLLGGVKSNAYLWRQNCPCSQHHRAHGVLLGQSGCHADLQRALWVCTCAVVLNQIVHLLVWGRYLITVRACVCLAYLFQLMEAHTSRDKEIKGCIIETSEVVGRLREARAKDSDNLSIIKQLRKEQNKVVPLFSEMGYAIYLSRIRTCLLMYFERINVSWGWYYILRMCRLCIYLLMICAYPCQLCTCLLRLYSYLPRLCMNISTRVAYITWLPRLLIYLPKFLCWGYVQGCICKHGKVKDVSTMVVSVFIRVAHRYTAVVYLFTAVV